jgi:tetratricopeptide (TPR) repeat protein
MILAGPTWAVTLGILLAGPAAGPDEPTTARGYYERGLARQARREVEGALADYSRAVELDPRSLDAWFTRGCLYAETKEYTRAIADMTRVIAIKPGDYPALFNRALYHESLGEYDQAIADYSRVLGGDADFSRSGSGREADLAHAYHYRGRAYHWYRRDYSRAIADYTRALELDPKIEMVRYRRGDAHHALGQYAKAEADYAAALARDPGYPNLLNNWAWQMATCADPRFRDGKRAVEMAARANQKFGGKVPGHVETLAAAHAECGQFEKAVEGQERALELLGAGQAEQREAMQRRLALYRARLPYREERPR